MAQLEGDAYLESEKHRIDTKKEQTRTMLDNLVSKQDQIFHLIIEKWFQDESKKYNPDEIISLDIIFD